MSRESPVRVILPASDESGAAALPNTLGRILRECPDAAARTAIVAVACTLFWLTWAHWGSIQVDCGREVYVPYQILRGKLLYRDLWYPYGPLEPYFAAFLLELFGQHLAVFYFFGLAITISCALLLFAIGVILEERAAGLVAALALLLQGFGPIGSSAVQHNFIFPYAYAATLGLLLALLCLLFTLRHILGQPGHNLMMAGLTAGLTLLCKQELGAACYVGLAFAIVLEAVARRSARILFHGVAACAPGIVLCGVAYGWFFWTLTPGFMVFDNWAWVPGTNFMRVYGAHYNATLGLRFVPSAVVLMIVDAGAVLLFWFWSARAISNYSGRWPIAAAVLAATVAIMVARNSAAGFRATAVLLVLFLLPKGMSFVACGFLAYTLYRMRRSSGESRLLAEAVLSVFALAIAVRVMADVVPYGYGIYYDMPLFLIFIIVVARSIRAAVPALSVEPQRRLVNALLVAELVMLAVVLFPDVSRRTARLETGWGPIYLQPADADAAHQLLHLISEQKREGRRVAVMPELAMMYAFTGTEGPSRWYMILPGFFSPLLEEDYISDLKRTNPDYIVIANEDFRVYGVHYFGIDFDQRIYYWIEANYRLARELGQFRGSGALGAVLYQRRSAQGSDSREFLR